MTKQCRLRQQVESMTDRNKNDKTAEIDPEKDKTEQTAIQQGKLRQKGGDETG